MLKRATYIATAIAGSATLAMALAPSAAAQSPHKMPRGGSAQYTAEYDKWHQDHHKLMMAANNPNRAEDKARDQYRHPVETIEFFEISPDMKVGEFAPGGGWYSRILGNYLGDSGQLTGLFYDATNARFSPEQQERFRNAAASFAGEVAEWTGKNESRFAGYTMDAVPESEKGTYDRILLIRTFHNLNRSNIADSEIKAMRDLLKDGGMMGIVQHRAKEDAPYSYTDGSKGYMRQSDVIAFMEANGFELVGLSEINANPKDTADHAGGVWEMAPVSRGDNPKLKGLGESDRMTLLFRKRP